MKTQNTNTSLTEKIIFKQHYRITLRTFSITLLFSLIVFSFAYYLDSYFNTKHTILIATIVISYPIIQGIVYKYLKKFALKEYKAKYPQ